MVVKVGLEMMVQGTGAGDVNGGLIDGMRMMSGLELSRSVPMGLLILDLESNILHHHLVFGGRQEMLVCSISEESGGLHSFDTAYNYVCL